MLFLNKEKKHKTDKKNPQNFGCRVILSRNNETVQIFSFLKYFNIQQSKQNLFLLTVNSSCTITTEAFCRILSHIQQLVLASSLVWKTESLLPEQQVNAASGS